jgi:FKBP-type peptidyl-prolyl cis-trans isomerase FklB
MVIAGFTACSEKDETVEEYPNWQSTNDTYFANLYNSAKTEIAANNENWKIIKTWSKDDTIAGKNTDYIVVQVLEKGSGTECPMYTDSALIDYRGRLLPSTSYPEGYVFDQSYYGDYNPKTIIPTHWKISAGIDGFTTALLNMHVGDRWRVYIPYDLGYGSSSSTSIPAYSTLVFDISLVAFYRPGVPMVYK